MLSVIMIFIMLPVGAFAADTASYPTMKAFNAASGDDFYKYYRQVYSVTFLDKIDVAAMNDAIEKWDISAQEGSGDVMSLMYLNQDATALAGQERYDVYICFGKTDGSGWYEVSVNCGDFFPQGPNSTLEVEEGSILVVRVQDMWIDDEFDFYVNGKRVEVDAANTITVVVDGYMLIGALSMDMEVPDVEESLSCLSR